MGNLSTHRGTRLTEAIHAHGAEVIFQPRYSPDFNPMVMRSHWRLVNLGVVSPPDMRCKIDSPVMTSTMWQMAFYRVVRFLGSPPVRVASAPRVLHAERARRPGAYLLAANHLSPFDAALLIVASPRMVWWLSIVELFQRPLPRAFLSGLGAMPLDRARPDPRTVRRAAGHLRAGRVVGIFPEGRLRRGEDSVLRGGELDPGVARLAALTGVPILPCVVLGGERFARWQSWVPGAGTPWVVAFGEPLQAPPRGGAAGKDRDAAARAGVETLARAMRALATEARAACPGLADHPEAPSA